MRRSEKQVTDPDIIQKILKDALVCRLAMIDKDYPYIVPVSFGINKSELYVHSALQGKKIDLIKKNPKIGFEIESDVSIIAHEIACKWGFRYRSIVGTGIAELVTDDSEKRFGLSVIMNHYSNEEFSFPQETIDRTLILKIKILSMTAKQSGF